LIGTDDRPVYYISPTGSDASAGTRDAPWLTFASAVSKLEPGDTLVLLDGRYLPAASGMLHVRCGVDAVSGTAELPITVKADHERMAFLKSDGTTPPLFVNGCAYWTIEGLHVESFDVNSTAVLSDTSFNDGARTGTVVVLEGECDHVILRRLLAAYPNRYKHSHVIRVGDHANRCLVEECEAYNFHHNGIEVWRATSVTLRRNYVHARSEDMVGWPSDYPGEGDLGTLIEESRDTIVENNIMAGVHQGIVDGGRFDGYMDKQNPPGPADPGHTRILGNVTLASGEGFVFQSRCASQPTCDQAHAITDSALTNNAAVGGATGLYSAGAIGARVTAFGAIGAASGVTLERSTDNAALSPTTSITSSLALGYTAHGFSATDHASWSFDHCSAFGASGSAFSPDDAHVTGAILGDPALGECTVYVPAASPLHHGAPDGSDIGPSVVHRYQDGVLTLDPLWDPKTGAFPCGAVVAGLNDEPVTSCIGAHQVLHVGTSKCPIP
jgi:hypothetical protein